MMARMRPKPPSVVFVFFLSAVCDALTPCPISDNSTFVVESNNSVYHLDNCTAAGLRLVVPSYSANATVTVSNAHFAAPAGAASSAVDWVVMCPTTNLSLVIDGVVFDGISLSFPLVSDGSIADCRHTLLRLTVRNTVQHNLTRPGNSTFGSSWIEINAPIAESVLWIENVESTTFQFTRAITVSTMELHSRLVISGCLFSYEARDVAKCVIVEHCSGSYIAVENSTILNTAYELRGQAVEVGTLAQSTFFLSNLTASFGQQAVFFSRAAVGSRIHLGLLHATYFDQVIEFDNEVVNTSVTLTDSTVLCAPLAVISIFASRHMDDVAVVVTSCDVGTGDGACAPGLATPLVVRLIRTNIDSINRVSIALQNVAANITKPAVQVNLKAAAALHDATISLHGCKFTQVAEYFIAVDSLLENVTVESSDMPMSTVIILQSTVIGFVVRCVAAPLTSVTNFLQLINTTSIGVLSVEFANTLSFEASGFPLVVMAQDTMLNELCIRFAAVDRVNIAAPLVYLLGGTLTNTTNLEFDTCGTVVMSYYWTNATTAPPRSGIATARLFSRYSILHLLHPLSTIACHMADALCTVCITSSTINSSSAVLMDVWLCSPAAHYTLSSTAINGGSSSDAVIRYDSGTVGGLATSVTLLRCRVVGFVAVAATSPSPCDLPPPAPGEGTAVRFVCVGTFFVAQAASMMTKVGPPANLFGLPIAHFSAASRFLPEVTCRSELVSTGSVSNSDSFSVPARLSLTRIISQTLAQITETTSPSLKPTASHTSWESVTAPLLPTATVSTNVLPHIVPQASAIGDALLSLSAAGAAVLSSFSPESSGLALVLVSPCFSGAEPKASLTRFLISPFIDFGVLYGAVGNIALVTVVVVTHSVLALRFASEDVKLHWFRLFSPQVRYPAISLQFTSFLVGGIAYCSSGMISSGVGASPGLVAGGICILVSVVLPYLILLLWLTHMLRSHCPCNMRFMGCAGSSWLTQLAYPTGKWAPLEISRCFGPLFSACSPTLLLATDLRWIVSHVPVAGTVTTSLIVGALGRSATSGSLCTSQGIILAAINFVLASLLFLFRPYRCAPQHWLAGSIYTTQATLWLSSLSHIDELKVAMIALLSTLNVTKGLYSFWLWWHEHGTEGGLPLLPQSLGIVGQRSEAPHVAAESDTTTVSSPSRDEHFEHFDAKWTEVQQQVALLNIERGCSEVGCYPVLSVNKRLAIAEQRLAKLRSRAACLRSDHHGHDGRIEKLRWLVLAACAAGSAHCGK